MSIRSLASSLGLAKDTAASALRRLSDLGVIEATQVRARRRRSSGQLSLLSEV